MAPDAGQREPLGDIRIVKDHRLKRSFPMFMTYQAVAAARDAGDGRAGGHVAAARDDGVRADGRSLRRCSRGR